MPEEEEGSRQGRMGEGRGRGKARGSISPTPILNGDVDRNDPKPVQYNRLGGIVVAGDRTRKQRHVRSA